MIERPPLSTSALSARSFASMECLVLFGSAERPGVGAVGIGGGSDWNFGSWPSDPVDPTATNGEVEAMDLGWSDDDGVSIDDGQPAAEGTAMNGIPKADLLEPLG